jgi:hypothetical protein
MQRRPRKAAIARHRPRLAGPGKADKERLREGKLEMKK